MYFCYSQQSLVQIVKAKMCAASLLYIRLASQHCDCPFFHVYSLRMLRYELICCICSVTHQISAIQDGLCSVWLEYRVCFTDKMAKHTYISVAIYREREEHNVCWWMDVCHQSLMEVSFVDGPSVRDWHSHLLQWFCFLLCLHLHWVSTHIWLCRSICFESKHL